MRLAKHAFRQVRLQGAAGQTQTGDKLYIDTKQWSGLVTVAAMSSTQHY